MSFFSYLYRKRKHNFIDLAPSFGAQQLIRLLKSYCQLRCACRSEPEPIITTTTLNPMVCEEDKPCRWFDATLDDCGGQWCNPGVDPGFCANRCNG